jgi:signal transduction histidine kinase
MPDSTVAGPGPESVRQAGLLRRFDRWLARLGVLYATLVLTLLTVAAGAAGGYLACRVLYDAAGFGSAAAGGLITLLIAGPMIAYSQSLLAKLRASKRILKQMTDQLALARDAAEEANQAKSRFLAGMSHELRTPLNAIIGFSEVMCGQMLGPIGAPRYREYAHDIHHSGTYLLSIINDILDLSKLDAGHATLEAEAECNVREIAEATLRMMQPLARKARIALPDGVAASPAWRIVAVERMVRQVLLNVLSNAIKFTPAGGSVALAIGPGPGGCLVLAVTDTGIGMARDEIKIALTPFGQVPNALTDGGGSGLGLPLARAMMQMHEGTLDIRSAPGLGTTVELTFPSARVIPPPARPALAIAS